MVRVNLRYQREDHRAYPQATAGCKPIRNRGSKNIAHRKMTCRSCTAPHKEAIRRTCASSIAREDCLRLAQRVWLKQRECGWKMTGQKLDSLLPQKRGSGNHISGEMPNAKLAK